MKKFRLYFFETSPQYMRLSVNITAIRIVSLIILFILAETAGAQDIIILKSGRQLEVNIIGERTDTIKFRESGDKAGPFYSVGKDMVAEIKYSKETLKSRDKKDITKERDVAKKQQAGASGEEETGLLTYRRGVIYQSGKGLTKRMVLDIMEDNPESMHLYETGIKQIKTGISMSFSSLLITAGAFVLLINTDNISQEIGVALLATPLVIFPIGLALDTSGRNKIKKSISLYNSKLKTAGPLSHNLSLAFTKNGIGIKLNF